MAPAITVSNQRGSALIESLPVFLVLVTLVSGVLLATYLLFARAWIQWRSEQALYCMAVEQHDGLCRRQLNETVAEFLPWGDARFSLSGANGKWLVEGHWQWGGYYFQTLKTFDTHSAAANRDLRW